MICVQCKLTWHEGCMNTTMAGDRVGVRGNEGLWCDCQHQPRDADMVMNGLEGFHGP